MSLFNVRTRTDSEFAQGYVEGRADYDGHRLSGFCSQAYREGWEYGYSELTGGNKHLTNDAWTHAMQERALADGWGLFDNSDLRLANRAA